MEVLGLDAVGLVDSAAILLTCWLLDWLWSVILKIAIYPFEKPKKGIADVY